jgi:hypothetical protein
MVIKSSCRCGQRVAAFSSASGFKMMIAGKQQDPLLGLNVAAQLIQKIVQLIVR